MKGLNWYAMGAYEYRPEISIKESRYMIIGTSLDQIPILPVIGLLRGNSLNILWERNFQEGSNP